MEKMPGYVIHLAVGKIYSQNNKIEDLNSFEKGIIAPDMLENKAKSHYGPYSSSPGLNQFIQANGILCSYDEGYFLHLVTDYLFYNRFLNKWDASIYDDYDRLNSRLIKKYGIKLTEDVQKKVKLEAGKPSILKEDDLCKFINSVGKINIRQIVSKRDINLRRLISENLELEI